MAWTALWLYGRHGIQHVFNYNILVGVSCFINAVMATHGDGPQSGDVPEVLPGLKKEGLDPKKYGLHSLCSGGASTAAALGIPYRLIQRHGAWKTASAKNNYIGESLELLLLVTKSMHKDKI